MQEIAVKVRLNYIANNSIRSLFCAIMNAEMALNTLILYDMEIIFEWPQLRVHYMTEVSAFKPRLSRDPFAGKSQRAGRDKLGPFLSAYIHSWKSEREKNHRTDSLDVSLLSVFTLFVFALFATLVSFFSALSPPINVANKNNERPPASSAFLFPSFSLEHSFAWWGLRWVGDVALNRKPPTRGYRTLPRVSFRNSSTLSATRPLTSRIPTLPEISFCRWVKKKLSFDFYPLRR